MTARCDVTGLLVDQCAHCLPSPELPTTRRLRAVERDAGELYDYAVDTPDGFTYRQACAKFGWSRKRFRQVVATVRTMLAGDEITLVCESAGACEPWVYRLVGNYEDAEPWLKGRVGDLETRLRTIHNVSLPLVNATDGRTVDGRKARTVERSVRHLLENLADIG